MKISERTIILVLPLITLAACGGSQPPSQTPLEPAPEYQTPAAAPVQETPLPEPAKAEPTPAIAEPLPEPPKTLELTFQPKSGSKLAGKAIVAETTDGVKITLALENVKPGDHGAHVHEKGDCSAPDAASAGGHYNPQNHQHALPTVAERHLGDLGNITIGKDGKGTLEIAIPGANLKANDPKSFLGRAIIVHDKKDDGGQPVGNAGGRIGCVEIK
jgi:Cu-Zn family superoxide dismutase